MATHLNGNSTLTKYCLSCIILTAFIGLSGCTTTTTTPPNTAVNPCISPDAAAKTFIQAWMAHDKADAGKCATPNAQQSLFATQANPQHPWIAQGCTYTATLKANCLFSFEGGAATLWLDGSQTKNWRVTQLTYLAD